MAKKNFNTTVTKDKQTKSAKPTNGKETKTAKKDLMGFEKNELLSVLRKMLLAREIDEKAMRLLRQGKTFFHIAASGHEAIQIAAGLSLNPKKDWLFPYYRDLGTVLNAGMTTEEFFLGCYAKANDPASGGRQLPTHWLETQVPDPDGLPVLWFGVFGAPEVVSADALHVPWVSTLAAG